jgi:hypothetical protein
MIYRLGAPDGLLRRVRKAGGFRLYAVEDLQRVRCMQALLPAACPRRRPPGPSSTRKVPLTSPAPATRSNGDTPTGAVETFSGALERFD